MQNKKQLLVKNLHRVGKYSFESEYGEVEVEVKKQRGGTIYHLYVEGRYTGLNRISAEDCWSLAGEYLGIIVEQG